MVTVMAVQDICTPIIYLYRFFKALFSLIETGIGGQDLSISPHHQSLGPMSPLVYRSSPFLLRKTS